MKLAVVGSRGFLDYELFYKILDNIEITCIVSGGAKGADSLAKEYAIFHNIEYKEFLPDWNRLGKKAGMVRNKDIVDASDKVIAFWNSKSSGTKDSINYALKTNKLLKVIEYNKKSKIIDLF